MKTPKSIILPLNWQPRRSIKSPLYEADDPNIANRQDRFAFDYAARALKRAAGAFGPLAPYVYPHVIQINKERFNIITIREHVRILKQFGRWLQHHGRRVQDIDEAVGDTFLRGVRQSYQTIANATLRRHFEMLRQFGVIPETATQPNQFAQILGDYEVFLHKERNLALGTVAALRHFANLFLSGIFGSRPLDLSKLHAQDITAFIQQQAPRYSSSANTLVGGTRSVLRYLFYKGQIQTDLSLVVPKVAQWSRATLPKHLTASQVRELLRHCDRSNPVGRRDYAILLIMARLGLRAGETVRLRLEDIDWENARVGIRGKAQRWAQMPLPADVARAIADYLRRDRPGSKCRQVFIRHYSPFESLCSSSTANIVRHALARAGIHSARHGAHLLRHSLATEMLRKGASLDEVGEVLRHSCQESTIIYAKVDFNTLRALAMPWPGGAR